MRDLVILACTKCKRRNYTTNKNKKKHPDRLVFVSRFLHQLMQRSKSLLSKKLLRIHGVIMNVHNVKIRLSPVFIQLLHITRTPGETADSAEKNHRIWVVFLDYLICEFQKFHIPRRRIELIADILFIPYFPVLNRVFVTADYCRNIVPPIFHIGDSAYCVNGIFVHGCPGSGVRKDRH